MLKNDNPAKPAFPVYSSIASDGDGLCYFFSPEAMKRYSGLVTFWDAYEVPEPKHRERLQQVV
jgi:hypothetical protein